MDSAANLGWQYQSYRDALGNVSSWFTAARIYYYVDNLNPVSVWNAAYNPDANTITVNWTNPTTDFKRAEAFYTVEGGGSAGLAVTNAGAAGGAASAVIYGIPRQDASGVQNGTPVSGGRRYDITVRVHSDTNSMDTTFKIWNFGTPGAAGSGMSVSNTYPAIEILDNGNDNDDSDGTISLKHMATGDANKKYVLVNDIVLAGTWTPKGTGSGAISPFKGTFYGNGHTISGLKPAAGPSTGLFGTIGGAEIRDLKVVIDNEAMLSGNIQYLGGVVGSTVVEPVSTKLRNLIVEVPAGRVLGFTSTSTSSKVAGGIAGYSSNGTIEHCFSAGTVTAQSEGTGALYAGGLMGQTSATPTLQYNAALGASVMAKGSGTKNIGRVYGAAAGTPSNNYAVNTMLLFSDTYNNPYPGTVSPSANATGKDGADAADNALRGGAFWTGLGFSTGWDFSRIYSKRHPALAGLGGQ
jgi:hypothetical protein